MDETISPAVVNSKAATNDIADIQMRHSDIVKGISNQATRVQVYNQNKEMETAQANAIKTEQDLKAKSEQATLAQKSQSDQMASEQKDREFQLKQAELDLKAKALTME